MSSAFLRPLGRSQALAVQSRLLNFQSRLLNFQSQALKNQIADLSQLCAEVCAQTGQFYPSHPAFPPQNAEKGIFFEKKLGKPLVF